MTGRRYGEQRQRAQLELRAAAAQFIVETELMLRWLDQPGDEAASAAALDEHHAQVLGRARAVEAALNHAVSLERLAAEPATQPSSIRDSSHAPAADGELKARRTIPIVGDPDKPKPEPPTAEPSPTSDDSQSAEPIPALEPSDGR